MKRTAIIVLLACASASFAQTLSTAAPNNGSGGVFMTLTPTFDMNVIGFDFPLGGAVGAAASVEVWTRSGAYAGFTASNAGWTLSDTISAVAGGTSVNVSAAMNTPLFLANGTTTSVYLHSTTLNNGLRYTGTSAAPPQTTWSNADLTLFSEISRTGNVAFGGSQFTPRTFSGVVRYESAVPEPATMALLGLGAAALLRRRRK